MAKRSGSMRGRGPEGAVSVAPLDWASLRREVTGELLNGIARRIVERFDPEKIVLFGSHACGKPHLYSDVDLFVVMETYQPMFERIGQVQEVAHVPFVPMDAIVRTPREVEERLQMGDSFTAEILSKGKVLYERARRVDWEGGR